MIAESHYWKDDLLRLERQISLWRSRKRWTAHQRYRLERELFILAYAIRRLHESHKLIDATASMLVRVKRYPHNGTPVTSLNSHRLDELYNFEAGALARRPLLHLCGQVIHSYIIEPCARGRYSEMLTGVMVCSERHRNRQLYYVSFAELQRVLRRVGRDYPTRSHAEYSVAKGDYVYRMSKRRVRGQRQGSFGAPGERPKSIGM